MMARILVTPRSVTAGGHPALAKLKDAGYEVVFPTPGKQPTEADLLRALPGCVGYLAGVEEVSAKVLEAAQGLKVISRNGVGVDNVDMGAARRLGIVVCKALGANSRGVAELAMAHILSLARWVPYSDKGIKAGGWERRKGFELIGKTLGLIGCGNIGRLVAKFALGMDMKVLAYDVVQDPAFAPSPDFRYASLDEVLAKSDAISMHCPALPNGKPLIDGAAIAKMKKGVFLINTARADLIDGAALAAALQNGQAAGAAVDVFKTEPPTGDPLVASDRVIATPHIGGFTEESVDRAVHVAVDNLLAELRKR
ncbi:MAG: phosphoglycerate dehydrogenase [Planctomycetota bacterium]|nr:phosphoglycerate dehydrogenase [Planctomycetota bacterium]